jgi:hypothetical protein
MNATYSPEPTASRKFVLSLPLEEQHGFNEIIALVMDDPQFYRRIIGEPQETLARFGLRQTSISYLTTFAPDEGRLKRPPIQHFYSYEGIVNVPPLTLVYLDEEFVTQANWTRAMLHHAFDQAVLVELDHRYWSFIQSLPASQAHLATDLKTAAGMEPSTPLRTIAQFGSIISLPWGFYDTFPQLDQGQFLDVGEAWLFVMLAVLLRDNLIDGQVTASSDVVDLQQRFMARARDVLYSVVGDRSSFWTRFEDYEHQVVSGLQLEAQYRTSPDRPYDITVARQIGSSKVALCKTIPCALTVLCDTMPLLPNLEFSLDAVAAGRQLLDDAIDWQEDLARGHYTYPLIQVIRQLSNSGREISPQIIAAEVVNSTIREDALRHARAWHQEALEAVANMSCAGWIELIKHSLEDCVSYHRELVFHRIVRELNRDSTTNN